MAINLAFGPAAAARARGDIPLVVARARVAVVSIRPFSDGPFDAVLTIDVLCHAAVTS